MTLIEMLLTLALLGIVLLAASWLLNGMAKMRRANDASDHVLRGLAAMDRLRCELRSSVSVSTPTGSSPVDQVIFTVVDPGAAGRLPAEPGLPWTIHAPANMLTVHYRMAGEGISREVDNGVVVRTEPVAERVTFTAALISPSVLELRFSFRKGTRIVRYSSLVRRLLP